jgi:hypothetical protein
MANTTFNGPVRSENGFQVISKNSSTGAVSTSFTINAAGVQSAPVSLADGDVSLSASVNAGRLNLVPNGTQDNTYTLPAPVAGLYFRFVYAGGAADGTDAIINTGSDTNFFIGGVTFLDSDANDAGDEVSVVYSDGNSNSKFQINLPGACDINVLAINSTNWQIWGTVTSTAAPAFADQ